MEVTRRLVARPRTPSLYAGWGRGWCLFLIPGLLLISDTASSGEWASVYAISMTTSYEDNPNLSVDDETPNGELLLNPTFTTSYEEERYRINFASNVTLVRSTDQTVQENTIRYGSNIDGAYDLETGVITASSSLNLESVQSTQFDDTGQFANTSDVTRTSSSLQLGFGRVLNDLWSINFNDSFSMTSFSGGNFIDSTNNSFSVSMGHEYSDVLTITPSIGYDRFNPEGSKPSNTYRLNLGGDYALSDVSGAGLTVGWRLTDGELGFTATANYDREFEKITFSTQANRDVIPSSSGVLRESTGITANVTYQYSEMTTTGLSASYRTSTESGAINSGDTVQTEFSPFISWVINEEWSARLTFRERQQEQSQGGTASSSFVSVVFNYTLPIQ